MQWYLFEWHPALTFIVTRLHHTHYCIKMTTAVDKMTTTASMYLWTTSMKQDTKLFRARLGKNHYQTGFLFSGKICRRWSNKDTFYAKWLDGVGHLFFQNPATVDEEKMEQVRSIFQPNFAGGASGNISRQSSSTSTASTFNGKAFESAFLPLQIDCCCILCQVFYQCCVLMPFSSVFVIIWSLFLLSFIFLASVCWSIASCEWIGKMQMLIER